MRLRLRGRNWAFVKVWSLSEYLCSSWFWTFMRFLWGRDKELEESQRWPPRDSDTPEWPDGRGQLQKESDEGQGETRSRRAGYY